MFWTSLAHHRGVHICIKPNVQLCWHPPHVELSQVCHCIQLYNHMLTKLRNFYIRGMIEGLYIWFYTVVRSLMMDH